VKNNKRLFYTCLFISIGIHLGAGWAFYKQPLFLRPYFGALTKKPSSVVIPLEDEDIALSEKNISLEEVMSHIIELPLQEQLSQDTLYLAQNNELPSLEKGGELLIQKPLTIETPDKIFAEHPNIVASEIPIPPNFFEEEFILPEVPLSFLSKLETSKDLKNDYLPHVEVPLQGEMGDLSSKQDLESTLNTHYSVLAENVPPMDIPQELELPNILSLEGESLKGPSTTASEFLTQAPEFHSNLTTPPSTPQERAPPSIPHLKSPAQGNYTLALDSIGTPWDAGFETEVSTMQREEGGYFFSVTLVPKYDMSRKQMSQNYYFLIDRTNSIGKHRYQTFKRAVSRALTSLEEGARFNIVVFDKKVVSLSEQPLLYSKKSLQMAQAFLEMQEHGSYFSAADLCKSLPKIIPTHVQDNEVTSVILITDGDSSLSQEKQRKIIQSFLQTNKGKISLYTAAVGEGNNLTFLDLLSSLNNGYLLYSDTHASFPRKLTKMVLDLLHPIAKDVTVSIGQSNPKNRIMLHSPTPSLPCLFSKRPYTIYGTADTLGGFTLVLQGKNKNELFTIKKNISFADAKNDHRALSKQLAQQQAHTVYEQYLKSGEVALLEQAKTLLDGSSKSRH
jgi:hypothetical protein